MIKWWNNVLLWLGTKKVFPIYGQLLKSFSIEKLLIFVCRLKQ